jgi:hypothetical protein
MTKPDDREPLFPPEWGWEKYESAFREYAERIAQAEERHPERGQVQQGERPLPLVAAGAFVF